MSEFKGRGKGRALGGVTVLDAQRTANTRIAMKEDAMKSLSNFKRLTVLTRILGGSVKAYKQTLGS